MRQGRAESDARIRPATVGQGYELSVPVPAGRLGAAAIGQVRRAFDEAYAQRQGYASPGEAVEAALSAGPRLAFSRIPVCGRGAAHRPMPGVLS